MNEPACNHGGCITCGDVALSLTVVALHRDGTAVCRDDRGGYEDVDVSLVEPVDEGDVVLVHARVALQRLDEGTGNRKMTTGNR